MPVYTPPRIPASEITPAEVFAGRRQFLARTSALAALGIAGIRPEPAVAQRIRLFGVRQSPLSIDEKQTPFEVVSTYNNFYEFGTDKSDPAEQAGRLKTQPWAVVVEGEIKRPKTYDIDELMKLAPLEERVYRLRCVEGWSMVIPWIGYPLAALLRLVEPLGSAKYVEFESFYEPTVMTRLYFGVLDFPYIEGLRLDEAMHPLTLLAVGLYGAVLPNQNGAPVRIVVPWKYGFKSAKSIVRIRLVEDQPQTSWTRAARLDFGFSANVNPEVDQPRWNQARERRLGELHKRPTLPFNGYADEVAGLYTGLDLAKFF